MLLRYHIEHQTHKHNLALTQTSLKHANIRSREVSSKYAGFTSILTAHSADELDLFLLDLHRGQRGVDHALLAAHLKDESSPSRSSQSQRLETN